MPDQRVLVVDNEPQRRENLKRLLLEKAIAVFEAGSCEEALALLAREQVDLVLTETELPTRSGLSLLRQVKEESPGIEVILITHNASSYNLLQALRHGAFDFIVRPLDTGEILHSALERAFAHIGRRRQNSELLHQLEVHNRALRRALEMTKALNAAVERVTAAADIEQLFRELLTAAMQELQAARGFLALFDRSGGTMRLKVGKGIAPERCRQYSAAIPAGLTLELARRGEPVLIRGDLPAPLAARAFPGEQSELLAAPGLIAAPLRFRDRIAGIVVLSGHRNDQSFGEHELHFLIQLSRHAALALEKTGTIHRLRQGRPPAT